MHQILDPISWLQHNIDFPGSWLWWQHGKVCISYRDRWAWWEASFPGEKKSLVSFVFFFEKHFPKIWGVKREFQEDFGNSVWPWQLAVDSRLLQRVCSYSPPRVRELRPFKVLLFLCLLHSRLSWCKKRSDTTAGFSQTKLLCHLTRFCFHCVF